MKVTNRTETALGGFFADPAALRGRVPDGGRRWSLAAAQREVDFASEQARDPDALRPSAPWDPEGSRPFPAIRRLSVSSPEVLRSLPESLGARPGSRYLEAIIDRRRVGIDSTPVALDPGGDLSEWPQITWVSRSGGQEIRVTTAPQDVGAVLLDTLDGRAIEWTAPPTAQPIPYVTVNPRFVQIVGRVSGVIDADLDGESEPGNERPVYDRGQRLAGLQALARQLKPREFARRTDLSLGVAHRAATGLPISDRNIEAALLALQKDPVVRQCALDGCDQVVARANAHYCSPVHAGRAYRNRKKERTGAPEANDPMCPLCGALLLGLAAKRGRCRDCEEEAG